MIRRAKGWLAGIGLALFLAACASTPSVTLQRPPPGTLEAFSLEGRLSVKNDGQNYSGLVSWRHHGRNDEILISSPLGQGLASLSGSENQARLDLADRRSYQAANVEELSGQIFGTPLPLSSLPLWVLGRASSDGRLERDARGHPSRLLDQGWEIHYLAFEGDAENALPTRLLLQRGNLEVRLAIDGWTLEK